MNKNLIWIFIIIFGQSVFGADYYSPEWVMYFQNHITNRQANQAIIFNALNLSDEQRIKFLEITNEDDKLYKENFEKLLKKSHEIEALKKAKAGYTDIHNQKRQAKYIRKEIKHITKKEDKILKKFLTRQQRSKYSLIKKLERHDLKKNLHPPDYYKKNPRMTKFGDVHLDYRIKDSKTQEH